jgi:hypothetical protein
MAEENLSPIESLQVIQSMIDKTKQALSRNSLYFLVWGWLTFIACIAQFYLKRIVQYEKHYLVWLVVIVGVVATFFLVSREERNRKVRTYVDDAMKYLWTGMGISFFILSFILGKTGWGNTVFPFFMMMYGLGTYVSGLLLRFRPLLIGGIISWMLALIATLNTDKA